MIEDFSAISSDRIGTARDPARSRIDSLSYGLADMIYINPAADHGKIPHFGSHILYSPMIEASQNSIPGPFKGSRQYDSEIGPFKW